LSKIILTDMKRLTIFLLMAITTVSCSTKNPEKLNEEKERKLLSVQEYKDAVYASWIGQIVGNTYGLCYEFKFIDEPGPDFFPYGYTWTLDELKKYDGAFSDDDTDIEYMYLTQMEKNGIEPTYYQLAEAWKTHVKTKVWCANRVALTLMHAGHYPPVTGSMQYNPQWCQIDPQLVNEIWAVTAPGMVKYAVDKSKFTARITNDNFGIEPTLHYAAMYSAAYFEKDINKLIDIGTTYLTVDSKFAKIVEHVKQLYAEYPDNWKAARKIIKDNYYVSAEYNKYAWPVIDANLNGALGIMSLIYGQGDFQKTLDYSCAFGMDADNQAATMCGLLGIVNGIDAIPENLMYPLEDANWEKPFNDLYKMITRDGLEDIKLSDLAERTAKEGEKIILANGGKLVTSEGKQYYSINTNAEFIPPFELNPLPDFFTEVEKPFSYPVYTGGRPGSVNLSTEGVLPPGIKLADGKLMGTPQKNGTYSFRIVASDGNQEKNITVKLIVHSKNITGSAREILFNENALNKDIELIRDGTTEKTYYSIKIGEEREVDYYGYKWEDSKVISVLSFNNGLPHEYSGWFTSFDVEYLEDNKWIKIENIKISPEMNLDNSQWLKSNFINYEISFTPVKTNGIRIIGLAGGVPKDEANAHLGLQYYTSISELGVYAE
jgi:hypothetical protein